MAFEELLKVEKQKDLQLEDFISLRDSLLADVDYLYERYAEDKCTWPEYLELVKRLHQNTIDNLISQKEKLAHIFKTKLGSCYFVLQSGQSWRIKAADNKLLSQPIMSKIFFLEEQVSEDLINKVATAGIVSLIDLDIPVIEFKKGASLLEIGAIPLPQPVISQKGNIIKIHGCRNRENNQLERNFGCGAHIGHQIREIIK